MLGIFKIKRNRNSGPFAPPLITKLRQPASIYGPELARQLSQNVALTKVK